MEQLKTLKKKKKEELCQTSNLILDPPTPPISALGPSPTKSPCGFGVQGPCLVVNPSRSQKKVDEKDRLCQTPMLHRLHSARIFTYKTGTLMG